MPIIETLSIPNFSDSNVLAEAELSADNTPPSNTLSLLNVSDLLVNDFVVAAPQNEIGELQQIQSITGEQLILTGNLLMQHRKHERLIKLFGNKINVYKAPDVNGLPPDISTYTQVGSSITIDPTTGDSFFSDNNGGSGFWYIFTYFNSSSNAETDKTLAEPVRGGGYGVYSTIEEIKDEAGTPDVNRLPSWKIAAKRSEANSEINGKLVSAGYIIPLQTQGGVLYVPPIIRGIEKLLSAGLVLQKNFGVTKPGSSKNGKEKIDGARKQLDEIQSNDTVLVDSTGQMLAKPLLLDGYPDDTTVNVDGNFLIDINTQF